MGISIHVWTFFPYFALHEVMFSAGCVGNEIFFLLAAPARALKKLHF